MKQTKSSSAPCQGWQRVISTSKFRPGVWFITTRYVNAHGRVAFKSHIAVVPNPPNVGDWFDSWLMAVRSLVYIGLVSNARSGRPPKTMPVKVVIELQKINYETISWCFE